MLIFNIYNDIVPFSEVLKVRPSCNKFVLDENTSSFEMNSVEQKRGEY